MLYLVNIAWQLPSIITVNSILTVRSSPGLNFELKG